MAKSKPELALKFIIRAKYKSLGIWLFLAKDSLGRLNNGSVYYWSTNMAISTCLFDSAEEALKKLARLKIKNDHPEHEVALFEPGIQTVYLNGKKS
jgi:hypothetical protein